MSERRNEVPFVGLEPTGKKGKYFEVKDVQGDPDLIVKEAKTRWGFFEEKGVHPLNDLERTKQDLSILKENFSEFIPDTMLIVGKNAKGKEIVYAVQHKIHGHELKKIKGSERIYAQLKLFLDRVLETYIKYSFFPKDSTELTSVFPDVKGWNFIMGKDNKSGDVEDRLYFVDTYPVEGSTADDFVNEYLPRIVKPTFPAEYWPIIDEFRVKAAKQIKAYLKENKANIPRAEL